MERYYYLALVLMSLAFPLAASFEPRIRFHRLWPGLFKGIAVMALIFLMWDAVFTAYGIWTFNPRYVLGVYFLGMPLEEWLFFLFIPYSCMFLYEVMNYFIGHDVMGRVARPLSLVLMITLFLVAGFFHEHMYTLVTCIGAGVMLAVHVFWLKSRYLGRLYIGYAVSLIPFLLVNGLLTGWLMPEPIVLYNNAENLGIRINTIPVEDSVYLLMILLIVVIFFERHRDKLMKRESGTAPSNASS